MWTPAQAHRFLESVANDPDAALWRFYLATGCRRGEALGLRWSDVDLDPGSVDALRRHRVVHAERKLAHKGDYDPDQQHLVFAKADGSPHHPKRVSARFVRRVARARVPTPRLHDLRHTAASIMLACGELPRVVQERLGHSTVAFTLDRYQKVLPGAQAEAAARYAQLLDGAEG